MLYFNLYEISRILLSMEDIYIAWTTTNTPHTAQAWSMISFLAGILEALNKKKKSKDFKKPRDTFSFKESCFWPFQAPVYMANTHSSQLKRNQVKQNCFKSKFECNHHFQRWSKNSIGHTLTKIWIHLEIMEVQLVCVCVLSERHSFSIRHSRADRANMF